VKPPDVFERICSGLVLVRDTLFRIMRSTFSEEKKLSIAALSQTLPHRLMLQMMQLSVISY
jgi:hypothetical protein